MTPGVGCRITITSEYPAIIITESEIQCHLIQVNSFYNKAFAKSSKSLRFKVISAVLTMQ